jgi:hypothetical protein
MWPAHAVITERTGDDRARRRCRILPNLLPNLLIFAGHVWLLVLFKNFMKSKSNNNILKIYMIVLFKNFMKSKSNNNILKIYMMKKLVITKWIIFSQIFRIRRAAKRDWQKSTSPYISGQREYILAWFLKKQIARLDLSRLSFSKERKRGNKTRGIISTPNFQMPTSSPLLCSPLCFFSENHAPPFRALLANFMRFYLHVLYYFC